MKEEITSRRAVLRGALAVGCGLVLPVSLLGCDSKPGASTPAAAPNAPPPPTGGDSATAVQKVAQASVQYQSQPKNGQKCDGCMFFAGSNTCQRVEGQISPEGWCLLWVKKA